jgi:cell division septation protein DedD
MNVKGSMARRSVGWTLAAAASLAVATAHAETFAVDAIAGNAVVEDLGTRAWLHAGETFAERDVIRVGSQSALRLRFDRFGIMELGPGTEIAVEKLPSSPGPGGTQAIVTLMRGALHVVWNAPEGEAASPSDTATGGVSGRVPAAAPANEGNTGRDATANPPGGAAAPVPLYVFFGKQRANIAAGEYFFEGGGARHEACVAGGSTTVSPSQSSSIVAVADRQCYVGGNGAHHLEHPGEAFWAALGHRTDSLLASAAVAAPPAAGATASGASSTASSAPPAAPVATVAVADTTGASASQVALVQAAPEDEAAASTEAQAQAQWAVNLGSYTQPDVAHSEVQKLESAGYSAVVRQVEVDGRAWYRVQLCGFTSATAARLKADELRNRLGFKDAWLVQREQHTASANF